MATRIKIRRGEGSSWESVNPVLYEGEIGYDKTANRIKVGDGVKSWNQLQYITSDYECNYDFYVTDAEHGGGSSNDGFRENPFATIVQAVNAANLRKLSGNVSSASQSSGVITCTLSGTLTSVRGGDYLVLSNSNNVVTCGYVLSVNTSTGSVTALMTSDSYTATAVSYEIYPRITVLNDGYSTITTGGYINPNITIVNNGTIRMNGQNGASLFATSKDFGCYTFINHGIVSMTGNTNVLFSVKANVDVDIVAGNFGGGYVSSVNTSAVANSVSIYNCLKSNKDNYINVYANDLYIEGTYKGKINVSTVNKSNLIGNFFCSGTSDSTVTNANINGYIEKCSIQGDSIILAKTSDITKGNNVIDINEITGGGSGDGILFGTCSTAAATQTKTVSIDGITDLSNLDGKIIAVVFVNGSTALNATLKIGTLTAQSIYTVGGLPYSTDTIDSYGILLLTRLNSKLTVVNSIVAKSDDTYDGERPLLMTKGVSSSDSGENCVVKSSATYNSSTKTLTANNIGITDKAAFSYDSSDDCVRLIFK